MSQRYSDLWLKYIKYLDNDCAALVSCYDNVVGIFSDSTFERIAIDFTHNIENYFQPIFECNKDVMHIDVSDDHRLIGIFCWLRNVIVSI